VVEALRDAVVAAYPRLSHRYYRLKASWLGLDTLQVWDRNAPLPTRTTARPWDEATRTVADAYAAFDPRLAELGRPFFDRRLDRRGGQARQGPRRLRPSHGDGRASLRDAELPRKAAGRDDARPRAGHGVHQVLAAARASFSAPRP
jgi:oligoendopeptidase F